MSRARIRSDAYAANSSADEHEPAHALLDDSASSADDLSDAGAGAEGEDGELYASSEEGSSSLEIPDDSIDFDVVYSLRHFVATIDGQASVSKGDAMQLMDDTNSYWWLVRVLKDEMVGYIPAENIETPIERLARLNKHRNVDLAQATQAECDGTPDRRNRRRVELNMPAAPLARPGQRQASSSSRRSVVFAGDFTIHNYPPAVWGVPEDGEMDMEDGEGEMEEGEEGEEIEGQMEGEGGEESWDEEDVMREREERARSHASGSGTMHMDGAAGMEPDDGMDWAAESLTQSPPYTATVPVVVVDKPAQRAQLGLGLASTIRREASKERMGTEPQVVESGAANGAVATDARKVAVAPPVQVGKAAAAPGPIRPSAIMEQQQRAVQQQQQQQQAQQQQLVQQQQQQNQPRVVIQAPNSSDASSSGPASGKRSRDEESADSHTATSSSSSNKRAKERDGQPRKLRKEPSEDFREQREAVTAAAEKEKEKEKKKKGGVFGSLFGRGKKDKEKSSKEASGIKRDSDSFVGRSSEEPPSASQSSPESKRSNSLTKRQAAGTPSLVSGSSATPSPAPSTQASARLVQVDKEQQAAYQRHLAMQSPARANAYATQALAPQAAGPRQRPGSLILTGAELSVLRVFAGPAVQSEATFKTVLLNAGTTSQDLIRQALQRFRLAGGGEEEAEYYLTVKQAEGSEAELRPEEKPLVVFEELSALAATRGIPSVKRSSITSINSLASNLSGHPAIAKLGMSDFTDDSAVKFYLNRRVSEDEQSGGVLESALDASERDDTLMLSPSGSLNMNLNDDLLSDVPRSRLSQSVAPDRFSSSSARFALQTVIHSEDLPDGMVLDPHTEAIVPRSTLRERTSAGHNLAASPGISQTQRKKVFVFAKNATVAEVIETALDRFGIAEGVVDGGDDVEDKMTKRRSMQSMARVRYGLAIEQDGEERSLHPSSKIIDAFTRQPMFKIVERRSYDGKRRSADEPQIIGSLDDIQPDDPVFILRRAGGGARLSGSSRSRHSVPLDDVALARLHAERRASQSMSERNSVAVSSPPANSETPTMSRQEIIAAQRAASRANQRAMLSAQTNSEQGVDLLLPDRARIRSSRLSVGNNTSVRYSYIQPDGETYDISDIIEEEWRTDDMARTDPLPESELDDDDVYRSHPARGHSDASDLLEEVLQRTHGRPDSRLALEEQLDRVLSRVKGSRASNGGNPPTALHRLSDGSGRSGRSSSLYSEDGGDRRRKSSAISVDTNLPGGDPIPSSGTTTPVDMRKPAGPRQLHQRQQPSIASVLSDMSLYDGGSSAPATPQTPVTSPATTASAGDRAQSSRANVLPPLRRPVVIKNDYGLTQMLALIDLNASMKRPAPPPPLSPADELLFGPQMSVQELHPSIRDLFEPHFARLDDYDKRLDQLLQSTIPAR